MVENRKSNTKGKGLGSVSLYILQTGGRVGIESPLRAVASKSLLFAQLFVTHGGNRGVTFPAE